MKKNNWGKLLWKIGLYLLVLSPLMIGIRAKALSNDTQKVSHTFIDYETHNEIQKDSYPISSVQDLKDFAALVNENGNNTEINGFLTCSIVFREEDMISGSNFTPIGTAEHPFHGYFDGCGYTIKGLIINNSYSDNLGLFGVTNGATIQNVCLTGGSISGNNNVGGICGQLTSSILLNCINTGDVTANLYAGGICGSIDDSRMKYCINAGIIFSLDYCGGICSNSINQSNVSNCFNIGYIKSTDGYRGSICAYCTAYTTFEYCLNDEQLCPNTPVVHYNAITNEVSNKLTTEMVGEALKPTLGDANWVYSDNMYPRPAAIANSDVAIVAATPVFLSFDNNLFPATCDTSTSVSKASRVNTDNGVTWSITDTAGFELIDYFVSVFQSDTEATLTVSKNNATKSITLKSSSSITAYGTTSNPIIINNATDLNLLRIAYNSSSLYKSTSFTDLLSCYCILTRDINLSSICYRVDGTTASDQSWTPIGNSSKKIYGYL